MFGCVAKDAKEEPMDVENGPANQTDAAKATNEEQATDVDVSLASTGSWFLCCLSC